MINQDRMIFGDLSVNSKPISLKFCKGHFLFKFQQHNRFKFDGEIGENHANLFDHFKFDFGYRYINTNYLMHARV